jgi:hypothetical protein
MWGYLTMSRRRQNTDLAIIARGELELHDKTFKEQKSIRESAQRIEDLQKILREAVAAQNNPDETISYLKGEMGEKSRALTQQEKMSDAKLEEYSTKIDSAVKNRLALNKSSGMSIDIADFKAIAPMLLNTLDMYQTRQHMAAVNKVDMVKNVASLGAGALTTFGGPWGAAAGVALQAGTAFIPKPPPPFKYSQLLMDKPSEAEFDKAKRHYDNENTQRLELIGNIGNSYSEVRDKFNQRKKELSEQENDMLKKEFIRAKEELEKAKEDLNKAKIQQKEELQAYKDKIKSQSEKKRMAKLVTPAAALPPTKNEVEDDYIDKELLGGWIGGRFYKNKRTRKNKRTQKNKGKKINKRTRNYKKK